MWEQPGVALTAEAIKPLVGLDEGLGLGSANGEGRQLCEEGLLLSQAAEAANGCARPDAARIEANEVEVGLEPGRYQVRRLYDFRHAGLSGAAGIEKERANAVDGIAGR